jgi:hypothetical protein
MGVAGEREREEVVAAPPPTPAAKAVAGSALRGRSIQPHLRAPPLAMPTTSALRVVQSREERRRCGGGDADGVRERRGEIESGREERPTEG